jgi:hypothetical protein
MAVLLFFGIGVLSIHSAVAISTNFTPRLETQLFGQTNEWGNSYNRITDFKSWEKSLSNGPKGIILGSSTAYRNINPFILDDVTKMNWFNLGSSSQSPVVSLALLKQITESPSHDISFVLFDVSVPVIDNNGYESVFDLITNSKLEVSHKLELFSIEPSLKMLNHLIYRSVKASLSGRDYLIKNQSNGEYLGKGFTCSPSANTEFHLSDFESGVQSLRMTQEINEIIELCKEEKIQLIINVSPVLNHTTRIEIRSDNIITNDEFNDSTAIYFDALHFNCKGSAVYSRKLASKIMSIEGVRTK